MADTPPPEFLMIAKGLIGPVLSAGAGLIVRWADDVRNGHRITWRRAIVEAPSVVGLGIMGGGLAAWWGLPPEGGWALAALLGHMGTQGVIDMLLRWRGKK